MITKDTPDFFQAHAELIEAGKDSKRAEALIAVATQIKAKADARWAAALATLETLRAQKAEIA